MGFLPHSIQNQEPVTLESLQRDEEVLRMALEEATKPVGDGGATEAVQEDLRTRYFLAKQSREDFQ